MPTGPGPLPGGYYLLNFQTVLQDVQGRCADLLRPGERELAERFLALPVQARRLYVRMLTRKGPWFRLDGLRYPEIPDLGEALAVLRGAGFAAAGDAAAPEDLLPLARKEEILEWLRDPPQARSRSRGDLAASLLARGGPGLGPALAAAVPAAAPLHLDWARLMFLLFFGNGDQDLTDFILADTGRVRFETYPLDPGGRLFQSREDVDFLLALQDLRGAFGSAARDGDLQALGRITDALLATCPHPGVRQQRRFHRLLNDLGLEWERRREPDRALGCYALSRLPPARERAARILAGRGRLHAAAERAAEMAAAPWDVGEEQFAHRFLRRLARHENLAAAWVLTHRSPEPVPEVRLLLPGPRPGTVEQAALEAARAEGWDGFFSENVLWRALFGLALWEVLFAPVPGAFQHRFQAAPADLGGPDFFLRRSGLVEARLARLAEPGAFAREVRAAAGAKRGIANVFVNWRALDPSWLERALDALPGAAAVSVLAAMAPNPLAFASGFPDLFLFRPDPPRCRLWEVKGPGDALRPGQERWLRHFNRAGIDARVARVEYRP